MEVHKDLLPSGQGVRTGQKLTKCLGLAVQAPPAALSSITKEVKK